MPSFRWSTINSGGEVVHGLSDAADRASVVERLQRQGQIVLRAEPAGRRALADLLHIELVTRRGLDRAALAEVTNELATMLAAGQDLDRALRFVFENAQHAKVRAILGEVRDKVRGGSSLAAALAAVPRILAVPALRLKLDRLLLRLPLVGRLLRETVAARLTRTLGTLLQNGVPLIPALAVVKDALGNLAASAAVEAASIEAKGGRGLARPLAEAELFPARTIHLLQLGEDAAQLAAMSLRAADIHDEQARLIVQRIVALLVPVITITMGLAVAGIVGSLREVPRQLSIELLTVSGERRDFATGDIRFNPDGSSTGGRISLADGRQKMAVGVDWLSGRVSVADVQ